MSKIKPARCAAVVKTYVCASGIDMLPAGTVRALPGNIHTAVVHNAPSGHTSFSPPSLLNHWNPSASGIGDRLLSAEATDGKGFASANRNALVQYAILQRVV